MTTKEELITELQQLAADHPHKDITRGFYRSETANLDSTWSSFFGSWVEFKRAAGLETTKVQRQLYSAVSQHSSMDKIRSTMAEKMSYAEKYQKPTGDRFITVLAGSDIHGHLCDPFWRRIFVDTAKRVQPSHIELVGDVFDLPHFSKYTCDPRTYDVTGEIKWVHQFLADLREAAPDAQIDLLEGNHSARLVKYLLESAPHIMPILDELHGMGVSQLLGLDKYEVNYIAKADLSVFKETDLKKEISKNYKIIANTVLFHHFPAAKHWGLDAQSGHHHSIQVNNFFSAAKGRATTWVQAGCGHIRNASYTDAARWQNGFCLWHIDTQKNFASPEIIDVTNDHAVCGGKWFTREEYEIIK